MKTPSKNAANFYSTSDPRVYILYAWYKLLSSQRHLKIFRSGTSWRQKTVCFLDGKSGENGQKELKGDDSMHSEKIAECKIIQERSFQDKHSGGSIKSY